MVTKITAYKSSDGTLHSTEAAAKKHEMRADLIVLFDDLREQANKTTDTTSGDWVCLIEDYDSDDITGERGWDRFLTDIKANRKLATLLKGYL